MWDQLSGFVRIIDVATPDNDFFRRDERMKRFLAALLAAVLLVGMIPAASYAATQYATVVGGWLRLRAGASFDADTITSYYTGTVVEILGTSGAWYRVKTPDSRTGYMYSDYLKLGAQSSESANAYVTSHNGYGVRLRKGPGTGYRVIRTYAVGTPVTVLEKGNYWCRIRINGTVGYMMTQFLNFGGEAGNGNESVLCYATIWSGNGYGVRLRTGPGKNYGKIGVYSVGTSVAVLEKGETWDRIRVGSRTGWMMNEFLHYQNSNEVTSVTLNTMDPTVGTVMSVKAMSPANADVSYAWIVGGSVKGTNSTYTVSLADVGEKIQLKVNGVGSYTGSAVSKLTNPVISNTQISNLKLSTTAPVVGDIIKATFTPADAVVVYAWKVGGYQVSNDAAYTVVKDDVGKTIELIVTGTGLYSGTLSASTAAVVATSAVAGVTIRNDTNATAGAAPMVGDVLSAVVSPAQATVSYQWRRNGQAIKNATKASYQLTDADLGAKMSVAVTGNGTYSGTKTASVDLAVEARPVKPSIDEYSMPDAMVGRKYATQLVARGGGKMTWKLTGGKLPDGLKLSENGAITGVPAKDGVFTFTVQAANLAGSDEKQFAITVVPVAKPQLTITSVTIPAVVEGYEQPAPVAVRISNVGKADAVLQQLWTAGTNSDCFIVNENGSSVIAAGAVDNSWTVQPKAGLAAGTYYADFMVSYDGGTASANVAFTVMAKPTQEPTSAPTTEPTEEPTSAPTTEPTEEPTSAPTTEPTEEPTSAPTTEPTEEPTSAPTTEPAEEPTPTPTVEPTEEPTPTPTAEPTEEPVKQKLKEPEITWDPEGRYVTWTPVEGATGYRFYRVKAGGHETAKSETTDTRYDFQAIGQKGDIFYVKALDSTGTYEEVGYTSKEFQ